MPPSASSNRPARSALASVNAPFTWPNISLSNTLSGSPPALTDDEGSLGAVRPVVDQLREQALARAGLAGDQHARVGARHLPREASRLPASAREVATRSVPSARAQDRVLVREAPAAVARLGELDLVAQHATAAAGCSRASRGSRWRRAASPAPRPRRSPRRSSRRPAGPDAGGAARSTSATPSSPEVVSRE